MNWFQDVTSGRGLHFVHQVDLSGKHLYPESIGSGCAFLDFDNDGRLDIYLIHNVNPSTPATNQLYHQGENGRFTEVSAGSGLDVPGFGHGIAVGDLNNDGLPEVVITEYDRIRLFQNLSAGKFRDVTLSAGLTNQNWSVPAAFFDYDRDGWLDLVVGNYLDFDPTQRCHDAQGRPEFCGPHGFPATVTRLFHNLGAATNGSASIRFEDVTASSGLARAPGKAMQIVCVDFDGNRWPDIFITDDGLPNRLFCNQGDGTFTEEAVARGLAYTGVGAAAANMGIALGDVDQDGLFDLFVPHLAEENHTFWRQRPPGLFQDETARAGLINLSWHGTGFAAVFADLNSDGALDLAVVNGLVRRRIGPVRGRLSADVPIFWTAYAEPSQLFLNDGAGGFREISAAQTAFAVEASVGRGAACGDIDNDGRLDLLVTSIGSRARLWHNVASSTNHWLGVRAIDPAAGGRDAYGAEIVLHSGTRRWWRIVQPAYSFASSNDPRVHFGLGLASNVERITVLWPDGTGEDFSAPMVDRYVTLRKGTGRLQSTMSEPLL
ncbi:MAG TPA: CRTAC1 family protein [Verrucomicrobiae bacterium]|nr:CRTAC1 family protein [Verrucomicrobiae bacterium]